MKADIGVWIFGRGIKLAAVATDSATAPVWMQIAKEGKYKGHADFPEVDFSRPVLEAVVTNFRKHPSYKAGADGIGSEPVVPFDYEHASEMPAYVGSIPVNGAPAPAWVLELQVRDAADGTAELWALAELGEQVRGQIQRGEYKWTSVAVWPNAKDPVSGDPIGPMLTSVAFTNHPFIQGMQALAASSRGSGVVRAQADVWGKAESPEEAIIGLRNIFGLDANAPPESVLEQLTRFGEFVSNGAFPMGIDGEWMMRRLRELFDLPALATWDEVMGAAGGFLSGLVSNAGGLADASGDNGDTDMPGPTLTSQLATILKCRDQDAAILAAAKETAETSDALDKLKQLFGSDDVKSLLTDAAGLVKKAGEWGGVVGALEEAFKALTGGAQQSAEEQAATEQEAAAAMASLKVSDDVAKLVGPLIKLCVGAVRQHALANAEAEAVLASMDKPMAERLRPIVVDARRAAIGNPEKLAKFRQSFPLQANQQQTHLLTQPVFAGQGGVQMGGAPTGLGGTQPITTAVQPPGAGQGQLPQHIAAMGGRNSTEKAIAYLSAKNPAFAKKDFAAQCFEAGEYLQNGAPAL